MPAENVLGSRPGLGSLQGCLVEGDPEERRRECAARRRALILSVVLQSAALLTVVLVPLLAKPARLVAKIMTPLPPYRRDAAPARRSPKPQGEMRRVCVVCINSRPANPPPRGRLSANRTIDEPPGLGNERSTAPCPGCMNILRPSGPQPPNVAETSGAPRVVHQTRIDPAMLIHRVEPGYPTLARQLGRSGRVEMRAMIATDGTVQSLQVVGGDPLFFQSALEAVRQWRYRPTVLNGQPVEIDTFITVNYSIQR